MKELPLAHFYHWDAIPEELQTNVLNEFADNGERFLALPEKQLLQFHEIPGSGEAFAAKVHACGMSIIEAHGPWGIGKALNTPDPEVIPEVLKLHRECLAIAAQAGAKSYTIHVDSLPVFLDDPRPLAEAVENTLKCLLRNLEAILPTAEKHGIVIAVENCFSPQNAPDKLLRCIKYFNSPYVRCCYDAGHANYMKSGKDESRLSDRLRNRVWRGKVEFEDQALEKLAPYVVTAHLHDNDGYGDQHRCPGDGTVEWERILPLLRSCQEIQSLQNEVDACKNNVSIARMSRTYRKLLE